MIPAAFIDPFLDGLRPGAIEVSDVVFVALGVGADTATTLLEGLDEAFVSHDNCTHQSVVCARPAELPAILERAAARNVVAQELPFRSGFHSPLFEPFVTGLAQQFEAMPTTTPDVPLWSATVGVPYPDDPGEIAELSLRHLVEPVRFRVARPGHARLGSPRLRAGRTGQPRRVRRRHLARPGSPRRVDHRARHHRPRRPAPRRRSSLGRRRVTRSRRARAASTFPTAALCSERHWCEDSLPLDLDPAAPTTQRPDRQRAGASSRSAPCWTRLPRAAREVSAAARQRRQQLRRRDLPPHQIGRQRLRRWWPRDRLRRPNGSSSARCRSTSNRPGATTPSSRSPPDWPHVEDTFPLVPMTGLLELLADAATELVPGTVVVAVEDVAAMRPARRRTGGPPHDPHRDRRRRAGPGTVVSASIDGHARAAYGSPWIPGGAGTTTGRPRR